MSNQSEQLIKLFVKFLRDFELKLFYCSGMGPFHDFFILFSNSEI